MRLLAGFTKKKNYGTKLTMNKFSEFIVTNNNKLSLTFQKILEIENIDPHLSLKDAIAATQTEWLRPADSERWHLHETKNTADQEKLLNLFQKVGMIDAFAPTGKRYDYILFMGGDIHGMQERLDFLTQLVKDGLIAHEIVFITAQRPLDADHELARLKNIQLKTEYDLLKFQYQNSELSTLIATQPTFVNTPQQKMGGKMRRATTPDGFIEWLKSNPAPGTALVISSQPLIGYQNAVALTLLPAFEIESVGPESSTSVTTSEYFDTLARWLYQEGKLRKII